MRSRFVIPALLLLAACAAPTPTATPTPPSTAAESPTASTTPVPLATPTAVTRDAMTVFIDRTLTPAAWIQGLAPYLSPQATADWNYTDPTAVPAHRLGATTLTAATPYLATVTQATDAGIYTVLLAHQDDGSWQIAKITPPPHGPA